MRVCLDVRLHERARVAVIIEAYTQHMIVVEVGHACGVESG